LPRSGKRNPLAETTPTLDSDSWKWFSFNRQIEQEKASGTGLFRGPFSFVG